MSKLVVLKFGEGSFEQGFAVTLQIGEEGQRASTEILGKLPPAREMPLHYSYWQSQYRQLGSFYRLEANSDQQTNVSITEECSKAAAVLKVQINNWLQAQEFRPVREKCLERLSTSEEIRVIVQTENSYLQRLPWHLWDLLERYPKAEIALSWENYDSIAPPTLNHSVDILAIVGNSRGIDTEADQALLRQCDHAEVTFVVEPKRQQLTEHLWGKNWDILFFAGHSSSQGNNETGRIYLNQTDSLSIGELKYALKRAIDRGLQLAIFNSCDGLGLARELASLHIPQIIIMREPVPDQVAQEFLKYFLQSFASGETLYQAVRHARERLQGLEDKFPCATWLPVICQHPAQTPPTWQGFIQPQETVIPHLKFTDKLKVSLISSLLITTLVCGMRFLGLLQTTEMQVFDQMMRSRPDEGSDSRLLVITINDEDLANQRRNGESLKGTSISDKSLKLLLQKLAKYQPKAIGLDVYRDFPSEDSELTAYFQKMENLVGVCKGSENTANIKGIAPPPEIPSSNLGFSDFVHDADGVVRRHLLFFNQEALSLCPASYALSSQLAFHYLSTLGIEPKFTPEGDLQLGKIVLTGLKSTLSNYRTNTYGQILLNYRSSKQVAEQITLTEFLSTTFHPDNSIKNRIVLIGITARGDFPDYWGTPYGNNLDHQMPGVLLQAHMVSQIISAVEDGRPLLRFWSPAMEITWIWGWSMVGAILVWQWRSSPRLALALLTVSGVIYVAALSILIHGVWVPYVPSAISLVTTISLIKVYNLKLNQKSAESRTILSGLGH